MCHIPAIPIFEQSVVVASHPSSVCIVQSCILSLFIQWFAYVVMEEAIIMYSSEGKVYNLSSNTESMHGEELVQSKEHEKINDLQERRYMKYGCQHYRRRCRIRAPCCNEIFHCRHCHNEAKDDIKIDPKLRHDLSRHQIKQVICLLCGTEQEVQQNCISCGVCMGKYFCGICKLFDDDVSISFRS
ncbi:uncharacterized protein DS421_8g248490 [Arachis hypogaea]|nr:uncharacterized protein DS421_8g248490 [Arachis hypogaea]